MRTNNDNGFCGRFFTRLDWAAFGTATFLTLLVVYALTLGPSVGL